MNGGAVCQIAQGALEAVRRGGAFSISLDALERNQQQRQSSATPRRPSASTRQGLRQSEPEAPVLAFVGPEEPARAPISRPLDTLFGRQHEIAAIANQLTQPGVQLVTLLGPGGVGKTRVAIAVAAAPSAHFAQGVAFIQLAPVTNPDRVLPTIAHALHLRDSGDRPLNDAVVAALAHRDLLLVLNNFEQVSAASDDLAEIPSRCPGIHMLVTSREPLRIAGERRVPVAPLALPPSADHADAAALSAFPAIARCLERARRVRPDLELTAANLEAIAEAVERANTFDVSGRTPTANAPADDSGLTPREREVLALVAAGWSDREIADRLFISRHTATTHVGNILLKLDVTTRAAAAARAVQAGYIDGQGEPPAS